MRDLNALARALASNEASADESWQQVSPKIADYIEDYGYLDALAGASRKGTHVWIEKLLGLEGVHRWPTTGYVGKYIITIRCRGNIRTYAADEL